VGHEAQSREPTTKPILPLPARPAPLRRALYASQETPGEAIGIAAQMERAERFGHRFLPDEPRPGTFEAGPAAAGSPAAEASAPIQRVTLRSGKKTDAGGKAKGKKKPSVSKSPTDRLHRWFKRGSARRERGRFATGRYRTSTGPISISGVFGQRWTQARKEDYEGETFGSVPPYATLKKELTREKLRSIFSKLPPSQIKKLTPRQRLAASLAVGLPNVSEEDRAPGIGKLTRALARQRIAEPKKPHPFDASVNPAVSTAEEARDLVSGKTKPGPHQESAIDKYASDSSDDEAEDFARRSGILEPLEDD
jgi:hypothetical protein